MTQISLTAVLFVSLKSLILLFCILYGITSSSNLTLHAEFSLAWKCCNLLHGRELAHTKFFIYISGTNLRKGKDNSEINKMFPCGTEKYTDTGMNLFNSHIYTNSNETMLRTHTKNSTPKNFQILSAQAWMEKPNHYIRNLPSQHLQC